MQKKDIGEILRIPHIFPERIRNRNVARVKRYKNKSGRFLGVDKIYDIGTSLIDFQKWIKCL